MKITKNLFWFSLINLASSIIFFTLLAKGIELAKAEDRANVYVTLVPVIYGLVWFVTGALFESLDKVRKTRYNLSMAYHWASTIVVLIAMVYALAFLDIFRTIQFVILPLLAMALSLLIHWLAVRNQTKGIDKKEAFK